MDAVLTFGTMSFAPIFILRDSTLHPVKTVRSIASHDDFGLLVDTTNLFNMRLGSYRVVKPLEVLTYKNSGGYSSTFAAFPRIVGIGNTNFEAQQNAIDHLLHSRNFYTSLPPERGTPGAKRQSILMKQYLQQS